MSRVDSDICRCKEPVGFIGAHASVSRFDLITRDTSKYQTYFQRIGLIYPDKNQVFIGASVDRQFPTSGKLRSRGLSPPRIRTFSPLDKPIGFSRWLLSGFGESVHPARSFSSQPEPKEPIAAYYTLVSSTVEKHDIPFDRSLPRQKIAVLLLV